MTTAYGTDQFSIWLLKQKDDNGWSNETFAKELSQFITRKKDKQGNEKPFNTKRLMGILYENAQVEIEEINGIAERLNRDAKQLACLANILHPDLRNFMLNASDATLHKLHLAKPIRIALPLSIASIPFARLETLSNEQIEKTVRRYKVNVMDTSSECMEAISSDRADIALVTDNRVRIWNDKFPEKASHYVVIGETANDNTTFIFKLFMKPGLLKQKSKVTVGFLNNSVGKDIYDVLTKNDETLMEDNEEHTLIPDQERPIFADFPMENLNEVATALLAGKVDGFIGWFPLRSKIMSELAGKCGGELPDSFQLESYSIKYFEIKRQETKSDIPKRNFKLVLNEKEIKQEVSQSELLQSFCMAFALCQDEIKDIVKIGKEKGGPKLLKYLGDLPGFDFCTLDWLDKKTRFYEEVRDKFFALVDQYDFDLLLHVGRVFERRETSLKK